MRREDLPELHNIAPIDNVPSICTHGILSHNRVKKVQHTSVAKKEIQDRRAKVVVPGGNPLHEYVCLYIHARNPMMYLRGGQHMDLCVIRVVPDVLDLQGVVVADSNASSDYVRFAPAPRGLEIVDRELAFAEYWTHPDPIEQFRRKAKRCAEVLVPERVEPRFIAGAYVSCDQSRDALRLALAKVTPEFDIAVNSHLFFH